MNLVKCDTLILFFGLEFIFHEQFSVTGGDFKNSDVSRNKMALNSALNSSENTCWRR